jgi:hypothetical protein
MSSLARSALCGCKAKGSALRFQSSKALASRFTASTLFIIYQPQNKPALSRLTPTIASGERGLLLLLIVLTPLEDGRLLPCPAFGLNGGMILTQKLQFASFITGFDIIFSYLEPHQYSF